ncbi:hypothetical protein EXIGLDRAFT_761992 [Exidia glandulosa HHB12029]|uniref:Uncharacterized protein n=1 Tax=Exidia glandulosa HHB12029 TaxID=1314781 RepID=A0A165N2V3_EXIGL|nr:hypothetical protein EXIGLDRAFT_761992 [Exidia glandulosa HHB12029]
MNKAADPQPAAPASLGWSVLGTVLGWILSPLWELLKFVLGMCVQLLILAVITLSVISWVSESTTTFFDVLHTYSCRFPGGTAFLNCSLPTPHTSQLSSGRSPVLGNPIIRCNIFRDQSSPLDHALSNHFLSMSTTASLSANMSLWSPLHLPESVVSPETLLSDVSDAAGGLSLFKSDLRSVIELANSTHAHWYPYIARASTARTLPHILCMALEGFSPQWQCATPRLARPFREELNESLALIREAVHLAEVSASHHHLRIDSLYRAFSKVRDIAWKGEMVLSQSLESLRLWQDGTSLRTQLELRRQGRIHSSWAMCALQHMMGVLQSVSGALSSLHGSAKPIRSTSAVHVEIALQVLQQRVDEVRAAAESFQRLVE